MSLVPLFDWNQPPEGSPGPLSPPDATPEGRGASFLVAWDHLPSFGALPGQEWDRMGASRSPRA